MPETKLPLVGRSDCVLYSWTEYSETKLPAAIENASTNIKTMPVKNIVSRDISAMAIPDKSPTVETKLSSTPKIKFLKNETEEDFLNNILNLIFISKPTP